MWSCLPPGKRTYWTRGLGNSFEITRDSRGNVMADTKPRRQDGKRDQSHYYKDTPGI